jgi:hypothetical protein
MHIFSRMKIYGNEIPKIKWKSRPKVGKLD